MTRTLIGLLMSIFLLSGSNAFAHDRTVVSGMTIVFGGEPEPMLVDEREYLVWRFADATTKEPIADIEEAEALITFGGKEYGKFTARGSRRDPGSYKTSHIFTKPGELKAVLTFKRKGSDKLETVTFTYEVHARKELEIGN